MKRQPQELSDEEGLTMQSPRKRQRTGLNSEKVSDPCADKLIKA